MNAFEEVVREVTGRCCFTSPNNLVSHFVKHVLEAYDEQWWTFLGDVEVTAAREEHQSGQASKIFWQVAHAYERMLSMKLGDVCQA